MSTTKVRLIRLALVVLLLAIWEFYARCVSTSSLIASPTDVALAWWPKVMGDPGVRLAVGLTLIELIIAFVLFLCIKGINRLKAAEPPPAPPGPTKEEQLLTEIRDLLKSPSA